MGLEVIGAGFGRTGTNSMKTALDILGYNTHHMFEVQKAGMEQDRLWLDAARRRAAGEPIDWGAIFGPGGYTAAVDWPAAAFWQELLAANPSAKVILTVRDFDKWYDSVLETIWASSVAGRSVRPPPYLAPFCRALTAHFAMVAAVIWDGTFRGRFLDREYARQVYESHIAEVQRVVPAGQLLLFRPADGWGPLCSFLGRPAPEGEPFPHTNDAEAFRSVYLPRRRRQAAFWNNLALAANGALAALAAAAVVVAARVARAR